MTKLAKLRQEALNNLHLTVVGVCREVGVMNTRNDSLVVQAIEHCRELTIPEEVVREAYSIALLEGTK